MLEASPELGRAIAGSYDHVLVDEYQDTNVLQARILADVPRAPQRDRRRATTRRASTRSAGALRNILDFPREFPAPTIVTLEQNYRSTPPSSRRRTS
jgi:DNA helicase-2/ATP-dependent DNA helicase PcrA